MKKPDIRGLQIGNRHFPLHERQRNALKHFKDVPKPTPPGVRTETIKTLFYRKWIVRRYNEEANLWLTTQEGLDALAHDDQLKIAAKKLET
jgi:hypothetical protein